MTRRFFAALAAGLVTAAIATPADAAPKRCDPLGGGECLLPFPNDYFTKKDRRTETGRRLALPRAGMPANKDGVRIDPRDWNRADGFSPGQQITLFLKGLNTERAARRNKLVPITDIARSLDRKQRVVLIDAETGERQLIWAEVDSAAPKAARRALLIRPAENLAEGRRYVVALRNLRTTSGKRIKPSFAFRVMRDGKETRSKSIERRRKSMRRVFKALKRADIPRGNLVVAWDFTVASAKSTTGDMLHMRDTAFARLGDTDLADLEVQGDSPAFTVVKNESAPPEDTEIARVVEGTIAVPVLPGERRLRGRRTDAPQRRRAPGAEAGQRLHGLLPLRDPARAARRRWPRAHLRARPPRPAAGLRRLRAGTAQDARGPEGLHRLRHLLERALRRQRRRGHAAGRRGHPGPLALRPDHRPAAAGDAQLSVPRPRDGRGGRPAQPPGVRGRVRRHAAPLLRRQLAGRDQRRRAHRGGARLRPRRARRARA